MKKIQESIESILKIYCNIKNMSGVYISTTCINLHIQFDPMFLKNYKSTIFFLNLQTLELCMHINNTHLWYNCVFK